MLKKFISAAAITCAASVATPVWATPIEFDLVQAMRDNAYTLTNAASGGGGETAAGTASLSSGGISVTFSAENYGTTYGNPLTAPYVYLDKNPDNGNATTGGAGLGVCQDFTTSCGAEDEVSIVLNELLLATFDQIVTLTGFVFSPENNQIMSDAQAEGLVAISSDGGATFGAFSSATAYTGSSFIFAVQSDDLGTGPATGVGSENGGTEFYLRQFSAKAVPEPATLALFSMGLLGMAGFRRRQRADAA